MGSIWKRKASGWTIHNGRTSCAANIIDRKMEGKWEKNGWKTEEAAGRWNKTSTIEENEKCSVVTGRQAVSLNHSRLYPIYNFHAMTKRKTAAQLTIRYELIWKSKKNKLISSKWRQIIRCSDANNECICCRIINGTRLSIALICFRTAGWIKRTLFMKAVWIQRGVSERGRERVDGGEHSVRNGTLSRQTLYLISDVRRVLLSNNPPTFASLPAFERPPIKCHLFKRIYKSFSRIVGRYNWCTVLNWYSTRKFYKRYSHT